MVIWIILLLTVLSVFSVLVAKFNSNPAGRTITSLIWAGYIVSQDKSRLGVTAVEGSWTVPQVNASAGDGYSSAWIGIGGKNDKTLIQVGTEQDLVGGQETYHAWYELLPNLSVTINELTIAPGDTIFGSLSLTDSTANMWNIQLSDATSGQEFNLNVNYNSSLSSGEWIVERPTINKQISTLCDFGNISFSNSQITLNNVKGTIGNFSYTKIQMANQLTTQLASVSPLSPDGSSFTVSYLAAS